MGDAADILEAPGDDAESEPLSQIPVVLELSAVATRTLANPPTSEDLALATEMAKGHGDVEVPGRWNRQGDPPPELISIP